ncbi:cytochrome c [Pseudodesulfovibrio cashew]|uniref:Cytochrome c n=1 Tax=Pseudodesulfovibrio cashew TaxID=2678688 RepID=A0A6I6JP72_9BACT|nr:cytochrome c [Pseudodesulfovibrio cashew]QGY39414.1 cytochrome c [Pseudodesulfovibrio cashew]
MSRKLTLIAASALITLFAVSMAFAMGGGNARKGKFLYRKNCRSCHNGSEASDLSPASKTQAQWNATFADKAKIKCSGDWTISDKDLNDIFTYLHDYASDSPSPAKCS